MGLYLFTIYPVSVALCFSKSETPQSDDWWDTNSDSDRYETYHTLRLYRIDFKSNAYSHTPLDIYTDMDEHLAFMKHGRNSSNPPEKGTSYDHRLYSHS